MERSFEQLRQLEMQFNSCNRRATELYHTLARAGDEAVSVVQYLNSQTLRILIARIKLFIQKIKNFFS